MAKSLARNATNQRIGLAVRTVDAETNRTKMTLLKPSMTTFTKGCEKPLLSPALIHLGTSCRQGEVNRLLRKDVPRAANDLLLDLGSRRNHTEHRHCIPIALVAIQGISTGKDEGLQRTPYLEGYAASRRNTCDTLGHTHHRT